jgi:hypothetical protein
VESIFICTAAFNETDLIQTIESAFSMAKYPDNVFFGISLQYPDNELPNLDAYKNVRYVISKEISPIGTSPSRALASQLRKNERYFLSIDAHTIFKKNWDESLIEEHTKLKTVCSKPIITTYVPIWYRNEKEEIVNQHGNKDLNETMPIMPLIFSHKDEKNQGAFVMPTPTWGPPLTENYKEQFLISMHFLFSEYIFIDEVPFDPNITYYEENTTALRAWTRGYRFFAVNKDFLWTREMFQGKDVDNSWRAKSIKENQSKYSFYSRLLSGTLRAKYILTGIILGTFGAPTHESLIEYESKTNINYKEFYIKTYKNIVESNLKPSFINDLYMIDYYNE